jgi:hypothetical protein
MSRPDLSLNIEYQISENNPIFSPKFGPDEYTNAWLPLAQVSTPQQVDSIVHEINKYGDLKDKNIKSQSFFVERDLQDTQATKIHRVSEAVWKINQ